MALLLTWSPRRAADHVALAEGVVERLPASLAALERGEIDLYKVRTVHELTMNLTPDLARQVEERVLEKAVDPTGARDRAAQAKAARCAGFQSEDDGMANSRNVRLDQPQHTHLHPPTDRRLIR